MTAQEILQRLLKSEKGLTAERIAKAKLLGMKNRQTAAVMDAIEALPGVDEELIESAHRFRLKNLEQALAAVPKSDDKTSAELKAQNERVMAYLQQAVIDENASHAQRKAEKSAREK